MAVSKISRDALAICAAAAMLSGCGASQPPVEAPVAMPQSPHETVGRSKAEWTASRGVTPLEKAQVIYSFNGGTDGANPYAGLLLDGGALYGTPYWGGDASGPSGGGGTVFKVSPSGVETILYRFQGGADGEVPEAGLTAGKGGVLYGATDYGGGSTACSGGCGTVFELKPAGSRYTEQVVYAFEGGSDGALPVGGLLLGKSGVLYGTTAYGGGSSTCTAGSGGCGTVYKLTPNAKGYEEAIIYPFQGGSDGGNPVDRLVSKGGAMYGSTEAGGNASACSGGCGTIFTVTTSGKESILYSFHGGTSDGQNPRSALLPVPGKTGAFYGATVKGGANTGGTVFELIPSGSKYTDVLLHSFPDYDSDGYYLYDENGLYADKHGVLYGTTGYGGASKCACGTVFMLTPSGSTSTEKILYSFKGAKDGGKPRGSLTEDGSTLYGTAFTGGSAQCSSPSGTAGCGTIFKISP